LTPSNALLLRENSLQGRSPLFVSCSNLGKQKAGGECNTTAYWGTAPIASKHTEEGGTRQFRSASCHRFPATGCLHKTGSAVPATPGYRQTENNLNLTSKWTITKQAPCGLFSASRAVTRCLA